ncbi:hypothetical protein PIB30_020317 [Stylosanthes scabra]|uniref:Uncharacterized protein n=1 Tax=Stylosanthes scabra TaxID=79078 RepID=A0ABU6X5X7_9FABA|nr:hypothetical protein [Stylosanthes scabra]
MAKVIDMGFRDLQHMPDWIVKQELVLHLASRFDLENNLIRDDVGMIEVDVSVVERTTGLPSCDYDLTVMGPVTLTELKAFVTNCPMETNEKRREFREAFILLLVKSFLCPTTNNYISPERHLPLVVDVANPRGYNWSLQIFTWIKDSIRDFQRKGIKHLSSCMFILVVSNLRQKKKKVDEGEKEEKKEKESEFENQNETDDNQEERVQNDSPMTSSQVERKVEKKPDVRYVKYHDGPSFSFGEEFNTPTPSPDEPALKDAKAEVLDIPPIREIFPDDIVFNAEENPSTIRSKPLTLEQENKIYHSKLNGSKSNGIQEEKIASWRGDDNFFLLRSELRFLRPKG